jgi:hypothetical protein
MGTDVMFSALSSGARIARVVSGNVPSVPNSQFPRYFLKRAGPPTLKTLADSKYVPVRVPQVHLADVPGHVSGWEGDVQPDSHAPPVDFVNVVHPDGYPRAFIGRLVPVGSKRRDVRPSATTTLASEAKKDLAFA